MTGAATETGGGACVWCGGDRLLLWSLGDRMYARPGRNRISRCRRCGSLDLEEATPGPAARPAGSYPATYYSYTPAPGARLGAPDALLMEHAGEMPPGTRVLDVGCGSGQALNALAEWGWSTAGSELSIAAARAARKAGHAVVVGDFGSFFAQRSAFDVVRMRHVLEHLRDGPRRLREAASLLRPGGWLEIEVPNSRGALARLSGRFWWQLDPPRHQELPSPSALVDAARLGAGLGVIELRCYSRATGFAKTATLLIERARGRRWYLSAARPGYFRGLVRLGRGFAAAADRLGLGDNLVLVARKR